MKVAPASSQPSPYTPPSRRSLLHDSTKAEIRRAHLPGMFSEFTLPPPPPPLEVLKESMNVRALRNESNFLISLDYFIEGFDEVGPCEADAIFRVFEGTRAPPLPLTDEERNDSIRRKRPIIDEYDNSYDERKIDKNDVRRVCLALCEPECVDAEVEYFLKRFDMIIENEKKDDKKDEKEENEPQEIVEKELRSNNNMESYKIEPLNETNVDDHRARTNTRPLSSSRAGSASSLFGTIETPENTTPTSPISTSNNNNINTIPTVPSSPSSSSSITSTSTKKKVDEPMYRSLTLREFKEKLQIEATSKSLNKFDEIFLYFEDPTSSILSLYLAEAVMLLILLSSFGGVIETMPEFKTNPSGEACTHAQGCLSEDTCDACEPETGTSAFRNIEIVCTCCFTIEYLIRIGVVAFSHFGDTGDSIEIQVICSKGHEEYKARKEQHRMMTSGRSKLKKVFDFITTPLNIIDLVAILPFYIELVFGGKVDGLNVVRLLRIARIFRMTKSLDTYRNWVQLLMEVILLSVSGLQILAFVFFLGLILFASLLFFTEEGSYRPPPYAIDDTYTDDELGSNGIYTRQDYTGYQNEISPFSSIPRSMWFVVVTGPSTGFGDMYPTTNSGKLVGLFLLLTTMLVLAFPVTIIAKNMTDEYFSMMHEDEKPPLYDLNSMMSRQKKVEELGMAITERVTAMRDSKRMDNDDACWIASQVRELTDRYAANKQTASHWDSCMLAVFAMLQRQPEGIEKGYLRRELLEFGEVILQ
jgi:hypothetical protein